MKMLPRKPVNVITVIVIDFVSELNLIYECNTYHECNTPPDRLEVLKITVKNS